jgi:hypothetical protein
MKYEAFGNGLPVNFSIPNPSVTFFRVSGEPLMHSHFDGRATLATADFVVGIGGGLAYLTFWGIDHDPYWIDLGGVSLGLSGGLSIAPIVRVVIFPQPIRIIGSPIAPS